MAKYKVIRNSDREYMEYKKCMLNELGDGKMSESAKTIVKDFDKLVNSTEPVDDYEDKNWKLLNRAIDYLREYVELGILN